MGDWTQYGVAAAVTLLILKEVFEFVSKNRKNGNGACGFVPHQQAIAEDLKDIRDGIRELVILAQERSR